MELLISSFRITSWTYRQKVENLVSRSFLAIKTFGKEKLLLPRLSPMLEAWLFLVHTWLIKVHLEENNLFQSKLGIISTVSLFLNFKASDSNVHLARVDVLNLVNLKIETIKSQTIWREWMIVFTKEMRDGMAGRVMVDPFSNGTLKTKLALDMFHLNGSIPTR